VRLFGLIDAIDSEFCRFCHFVPCPEFSHCAAGPRVLTSEPDVPIGRHVEALKESPAYPVCAACILASADCKIFCASLFNGADRTRSMWAM
jgi:hypothetical protein